MSGRIVEIAGLNLGQRLAVTSDDRLGRIVEMLDADGLKTEDTEDAATVVIEWSFGGFSPAAVSDFEIQPAN